MGHLHWSWKWPHLTLKALQKVCARRRRCAFATLTFKAEPPVDRMCLSMQTLMHALVATSVPCIRLDQPPASNNARAVAVAIFTTSTLQTYKHASGAKGTHPQQKALQRHVAISMGSQNVDICARLLQGMGTVLAVMKAKIVQTPTCPDES